MFRTQSFTHNLSHTIFHIQLCHTQSLTYNFVTHNLWHTASSRTHTHNLSHTAFHIYTALSHAIFHTQLCHTQPFTHNLSHTTLSHTHTFFQIQLCRTQLCHAQSFTHTAMSHRTFIHTTLWHINFHTQLCHAHRQACHTHTHICTHNFCTHNLSRTALSHTQSFKYNFVTHAHNLSRTTLAWQGWHLWHWAGSGRAWSLLVAQCRGMALGTGLGLVARLVAASRPWRWGHFAWQAWFCVAAWHWVTSILVLHGRPGAYGTELGRVARLVARDAVALCVAGVALDDIDLRLAWLVWCRAWSPLVMGPTLDS